jgi:FlaA1/EpsC-like NDP-sugar epimerase
MDLDIRDVVTTRRRLWDLRPDVVFHLTAQREPGLAEEQVDLTVRTNVLGTRNVVEAAEDVGATELVYASTGMALRPWTSDIYAESKRMGGYVLSRATARGRMECSGARFAHVVDNSIVLRRFWQARHDGRPLRLHSPRTAFYAQSARESAQLMLVALAESRVRPRPVLRLFMIRKPRVAGEPAGSGRRHPSGVGRRLAAVHRLRPGIRPDGVPGPVRPGPRG